MYQPRFDNIDQLRRFVNLCEITWNFYRFIGLRGRAAKLKRNTILLARSERDRLLTYSY